MGIPYSYLTYKTLYIQERIGQVFFRYLKSMERIGCIYIFNLCVVCKPDNCEYSFVNQKRYLQIDADDIVIGYTQILYWYHNMNEATQGSNPDANAIYIESVLGGKK